MRARTNRASVDVVRVLRLYQYNYFFITKPTDHATNLTSLRQSVYFTCIDDCVLLRGSVFQSSCNITTYLAENTEKNLFSERYPINRKICDVVKE